MKKMNKTYLLTALGVLGSPLFVTDANAQTFYQCMPLACKNGQYIKDGKCTDCSAGTYQSGNDRATSCSPCPSGKYSGAGATSCTTCEAGNYCSGGLKYACAAGKYSGAGATSCSSCGAGQTSTAGASSCSTCSNGTYASNNTCVSCPAGSRCSGGIKYTCSAGTYSAAGASSCSTCSAGTYSTGGAASCTNCSTKITLRCSYLYCNAGGCSHAALDREITIQYTSSYNHQILYNICLASPKSLGPTGAICGNADQLKNNNQGYVSVENANLVYGDKMGKDVSFTCNSTSGAITSLEVHN